MVKINISKEELLEAINNGYDSEKLLTQHFNTSLSTIRRRLREANIKLFKYCFDTDSFFKLYQLGYNDTEIAKQLGVTHSTISDYRCNQGLPKNFKYRKELEKESIMSLYNEGKNIHEISKILNVDSRLVDLYINEKQITDDYVLSPTEEQIILGSLLGDGNITANKSNTKSHLVFAHSPKQKNYCIWKTQMLQNIMYFHYSFREVMETDKRSGKEYTSYRALSKDLPILDDFQKRWYVKVNNRNVKIINKDDLYKVNALGLAIWFMDDGYKDHNTGYMIATQCFSKDNLNTIKSYFKDVWDIDITIRTNGEIYIGSKYKDKFTSIIEPFIHSDCKYKLIKSSCKTPLNGETPEKDNPVLNPPEMEENAERLEVMLTE